MPQNRDVSAAARHGKRGFSGVAAATAALLVAVTAIASFGPANSLFAEPAGAASAPALPDSYTDSFLAPDAPVAKEPPPGAASDGEAATALRNWTYTDRVPSRFN
jgi:hypothetical protein